MELIDKALQLFDEIEARQRQLREILIQLQGQTTQSENSEHSENSENSELSENSENSELSEPKEPVVVSRPRPDLWKSLTINDRFRFRRELFAGDDAAMAEAINRLSEMDSLSEADAYLSAMPWESDSEAVGEFMTLLSNHFSRF